MDWHLEHAIHGNKPWAVQVEAQRRANGADRFGYFLDPGLGKTALTLNDYAEYDCEIMLVIAPNSFKLDWKYEPADWGVTVPCGAWPKDPVPFKEDLAIYSVNYEAMRSSAKRDLHKLLRERSVMLVFDESGEYRNPQSITARTAIELSKDADMVRILNGTPLATSVMDYYPQLRTLGELNGVNPYAFRAMFAKMGGYMSKQVVGMKNEDELFNILNRVSFRALTSEWRKDLPPRRYHVHRLDMSDKQLRHYREMQEDFYTICGDQECSAAIILTQLDKLRQIASGLIYQDGKHTWIEPPNKNPRMRATMDMVDGAHGKSIVVHHYKPTGAALLEAFKAEGFAPAFIRGGMSSEDLFAEKKRFNEDPKCRVMVCQQGASYRGHTLIGFADMRANNMVFYENEFSWYRRTQMEMRINRGAQDQICDYTDFSMCPIDNKYISVLASKRNRAEYADSKMSNPGEGDFGEVRELADALLASFKRVAA